MNLIHFGRKIFFLQKDRRTDRQRRSNSSLDIPKKTLRQSHDLKSFGLNFVNTIGDRLSKIGQGFRKSVSKHNFKAKLHNKSRYTLINHTFKADRDRSNLISSFFSKEFYDKYSYLKN